MISAQNPAVTIEPPVYDGEELVDATIDQALEQSFRSIGLIVSDNALTHTTDGICRRHALQGDRTAYLRAELNHSVTRSFNLLVVGARGRRLKWAAHDEPIAPMHLYECVRALDGDSEAVLANSIGTTPCTWGVRIRGYENRLTPAVHYCSAAPSAHFREMTRGLHACYEVVDRPRTDTLQRMRRIEIYTVSDRSILTAPALAGTFSECPERRSFPRDHSARSVRRLPPHDRIRWFDTSQLRRVSFPYSRVHRELRLAIRPVDLSAAERRRGRPHLRRSTLWQARLLRGVVLRAARSEFSGLIRPRKVVETT